MNTRDETKKSLWPQNISYGSFYFYHCYLIKHIKIIFLNFKCERNRIWNTEMSCVFSENNSECYKNREFKQPINHNLVVIICIMKLWIFVFFSLFIVSNFSTRSRIREIQKYILLK